MIDIGLEAMRYQGPKGPLAEGLNTLFASVNAYKKTLNGSNQSKIAKIHKFVLDKKFMDSFRDIVKTNSGLELSFKFYAIGPSYIFAISFEPTEEISEYDGAVEYTRYQSDYPYSDDERKMLEKTRASVDRDLSKIIDPKNANNVISNKASLHMCVDTAFCLEFYHEKIRPLSSEELTAIILHEIGHVLSVIDYASFMYRTLQEYTAPVKVSIKTIADAKKAVKTAKKAVDNLEKKNGSSKYTKLPNRAILKLEELLDDKPNINIFKLAICHLATALLMIVMFPVTIIVMLDMIAMLWSEDILDMIEYNKKYLTKDSDFKHTRKELTDIEFRADEFVSAFGYSDHLVRGLDILTMNSKIVTPKYDGTGAPVHKGQSMLPYHMNHIQMILLAPYFAVIESHGTDKDRYAKIQRTMIKQMKAADLPAPLMEDLVLQYRNTKTIVEAAQQHAKKNHMMYLKYGMAQRFIMTGGGLINLIINGKADKDYSMLMETAERFANNELTYQSKRLELS